MVCLCLWAAAVNAPRVDETPRAHPFTWRVRWVCQVCAFTPWHTINVSSLRGDWLLIKSSTSQHPPQPQDCHSPLLPRGCLPLLQRTSLLRAVSPEPPCVQPCGINRGRPSFLCSALGELINSDTFQQIRNAFKVTVHSVQPNVPSALEFHGRLDFPHYTPLYFSMSYQLPSLLFDHFSSPAKSYWSDFRVSLKIKFKTSDGFSILDTHILSQIHAFSSKSSQLCQFLFHQF